MQPQLSLLSWNPSYTQFDRHRLSETILYMVIRGYFQHLLDTKYHQVLTVKIIDEHELEQVDFIKFLGYAKYT